ncbi:MAG: alpha/beta hydrolase [Burkholderiales bacterium]|nr:alpha/beta hydrolase [Burkholderiales bacterium]
MPYATINGLDLYYESHGSGPAVVFAHGRGGNHLNWWRQIPVFAREYRCITFDHREFGLSRNPPDARGKSAYVEDLAGLLDHLKIESTCLVGQSMGGWACLNFALQFPARSKALVLANTTGGIGDASVVDVLIEHGDPGAQRISGKGFDESNPELAFLLAQFRTLNDALNPPLRESRASFMTSREGPKAAELAGLSVPTLLIGATGDVLFPPAVMQACAKLIPGARLKLFEGAGHFVHYELPGEFNETVASFLKEHSS